MPLSAGRMLRQLSIETKKNAFEINELNLALHYFLLPVRHQCLKIYLIRHFMAIVYSWFGVVIWLKKVQSKVT